VVGAAVMEFDRDKLPASIEVAEQLSTNAYADCRSQTLRNTANCEMHSTVSLFSRECCRALAIIIMFGSFFPSPLLVWRHKVYSGQGPDIGIESFQSLRVSEFDRQGTCTD
jgi:hypothetical protein